MPAPFVRVVRVTNKEFQIPHKSYDKPGECFKKQRHHFANKCPYSQGLVFPVVTHKCESLTIKKAECRTTDAFELWCWRRLLRVPCTARRSNKSILKEINPEYSLEALMLKLQYFGHLLQTSDTLEKTLILEKIEDIRRRGGQRMRRLAGITNSKNVNLGKLQKMVGDSDLVCCGPWGYKKSGMTW